MAPKKLKKTKNSKKNNNNNTVPNVEEENSGPVLYSIDDIPTHIQLLKCEQEDVKTKAFFAITRLCEDKSLLEMAFSKGLFRNLMPFVYSTDILILKQSLKVVINCLKFANGFSTFTIDEWLQYQKQITCLFMDSSDTVLKEYAANILTKLTLNSTIANIFIQEDTIRRLFDILNNETDVDILYHTLSIINNVLSLPEATCVVEYPRFSISTLLCFVEKPILKLANMASTILLTITEWRDLNIQERLMNVHIIVKIVPLIINLGNIELQQLLINILSILLETSDIAEQFTDNLLLLRICEFAPKCDTELILPLSKTFLALCNHTALIQKLYDLSIEDAVLTLLRYKNVELITNVAQIVLQFMQNQFCCEKLTTPVLLKTFLSVCIDKNVEMLPYKDINFKILHEYLKRNSKAFPIFVSLNGIEALVDTFECQLPEIITGNYNYILDLIYLLASHTDYKLTVMNTSTYPMILEIFQYSPEKILYILNQYVQYEIYQDIFLQYGGPKQIVNELEITNDMNLFTHLLAYIRNSIIYDNMVLPYLKEDLITKLKSLQCKPMVNRYSIEKLINDLYNLHLPLKLHETKRLEITDNIRHKFYLVKENVPLPCSFLSLLEYQHVSSKYIIYVIDVERYYSNCDNDSESDTSLTNSLDLNRRYDTMFESTTSVKSLDLSSNSSLPSDINLPVRAMITEKPIKTFDCTVQPVERPKCESGLKSILKKRDDDMENQNVASCSTQKERRVSFADDVCPAVIQSNSLEYLASHANVDLLSYVEDIQRQIRTRTCLCITNKLKIVADYVGNVYAFSDDCGIDYQLIYKIRLEMLKKRLGSSIIPLELVSLGLYCERALLFKFLCDMLGLPATLVKGDNLYYNEVPLENNRNRYLRGEGNLTYHVVDLIFNIGNFLPLGSIDANLYLNSSVP